MQNTVPSTMGTLMSSGVMQAGKALKGKVESLSLPTWRRSSPRSRRNQEGAASAELGDG